MSQPRSGLALGLVATLVAAGSAVAQDSSPAMVSPVVSLVEVRIGTVLASNSGSEFDSRLASLGNQVGTQLKTLFTYSSYRLVKEERQQVAWGAKAGFDVPGGRYVLVIPRELKNDRLSMKILVIDGNRSIVDTVVSLRNHGTFFVGGPRERDGVLILAIGASTVLHR